MARDANGGLEVRLEDLVSAVSEALDLMCPEVVGHHARVADISLAMMRQLNLPDHDVRDILTAALLHDGGAFSLHERLALMEFETEAPQEHADAGFQLLRAFPHFERAATLVRFHHVPWDHGRGEIWRGEPVPLGSHVLHLADRVSVLPLSVDDLVGRGKAVLQTIRERSGSHFAPELVEALEAAAAREGFWLAARAPTPRSVLDRAALGSVVLSLPDLRQLVRLFWQLVDFRSPYTATHTAGVAAVAGFLAPLCGVGEGAAQRLWVAAALHDLGKLAVPPEILDKERTLNRDDRTTLRCHPYYGYRILGAIPGLEEVNVWANYHHERLDGSGYPFHLPAARIPLESRVVSVADVFTALTEERPYRRGMSGRETVAILHGMASGGALDPEVVAVAELHREEVNAVRRLAQNRAGLRYLALRQHDGISEPTLPSGAA